MKEVTALKQDNILDEQLVKDYLLDHPQFFVNNSDILVNLRVPHQERGAISLVERQQEILRTKVQILEEEITQLMGIARQNENIFLTFSELYLQIIDSENEASLYQALLDILNRKLNLTSIYLKSFVDDGAPFHIKKASLQALLDHRLAKKDFYFGRLTVDEQQLLFSEDEAVKSVALMLLGDQGETGIVAFGSCDENHFYPGMDTLFLRELAKILALMLDKFK